MRHLPVEPGDIWKCVSCQLVRGGVLPCRLTGTEGQVRQVGKTVRSNRADTNEMPDKFKQKYVDP